MEEFYAASTVTKSIRPSCLWKGSPTRTDKRAKWFNWMIITHGYELRAGKSTGNLNDADVVQRCADSDATQNEHVAVRNVARPNDSDPSQRRKSRPPLFIPNFNLSFCDFFDAFKITRIL